MSRVLTSNPVSRGPSILMPATLYVVATPIGNLADISARAIEVLESVKLIACEDTRTTRRLLSRHGIKTRTISYHEHNENQRAPQLVKRLSAGEDLALVSDAGTPGISDPGYRLMAAARGKRHSGASRARTERRYRRSIRFRSPHLELLLLRLLAESRPSAHQGH